MRIRPDSTEKKALYIYVALYNLFLFDRLLFIWLFSDQHFSRVMFGVFYFSVTDIYIDFYISAFLLSCCIMHNITICIFLYYCFIAFIYLLFDVFIYYLFILFIYLFYCNYHTHLFIA